MYPEEYIAFLTHFHGDRDYFECHEILEEYWKGFPSEARDSIWVGLIQIAVSLYHQRRGNFAGAAKMLGSAIRILSQKRGQVNQLGLDEDMLLDLLRQKLTEIERCQPYVSINLPIRDDRLLEECRHRCAQQGKQFGQESNLADEQLLHRHMLRDRSDVVAEREQSLKNKQASRKKA